MMGIICGVVMQAACIAGEKFITHCTVTTYNAVQSQCDDDPLVTADGTKIDIDKLNDGTLRLVAVSRDLLWCLPYGSIVEVEGHGKYKVADTMHKRWEHRIDILLPENKKHFKKEHVKVTLVANPDNH